MAVKPVTWVPWAKARSNMFKICVRWSWDADNADTAFVHVLRWRNVSYNGEAREIDHLGRWGKPINLKDVVDGLLSMTSYGRAEYERARSSSAPAIGRLPLYSPPQPIQKVIADVSGAELAWEEFHDKLITYAWPPGEPLYPDPAEIPTDQERRHAARASARGSSSSSRKQRRAYERRVKEFRELGRNPPVQTTADGNTQGDREWAVANGVSRTLITEWRRQLLNEPSRGRPPNSKGNSADK